MLVGILEVAIVVVVGLVIESIRWRLRPEARRLRAINKIKASAHASRRDDARLN